MKRLSTLLLSLLLVSVILLAQSHMKFMDIPMSGDFETFKQKLEEKDVYKDSYNKRGFSGHFFGTIAAIDVTDNKTSGNIYKVVVRYNESVTMMNQSQILALYKRLCQGLRNKYPKAKVNSVDGDLLLTLVDGYIRCQVFGMPKTLGGATIELTYVDKLNSPKYEIPSVKNRDDDL